MFYQTADISDLPRLIALIFLELLLSADNAIVLGILVHPLPKEQRRKALLIGFFSACFFRGLALLSLSVLLQYRWIQVLGGLYLLYLSVHYFFKQKTPEQSLSVHPTRSFWKTVVKIELFDLAFAIDSIIAGIAFIASTRVDGGINPKLWVVYVGGLIGIFGIRYAAQLFSQWIDRFPRLELSAHILIGWVGFKLIYTTAAAMFSLHIPYEPIFWSVFILVILFGFSKSQKKEG